MPCHNRHLPTEIPHTFVPAMTHPNICIAMLDTATDDEHGFSHQAQCGHHKNEHTQPEGHTK